MMYVVTGLLNCQWSAIWSASGQLTLQYIVIVEYLQYPQQKTNECTQYCYSVLLLLQGCVDGQLRPLSTRPLRSLPSSYWRLSISDTLWCFFHPPSNYSNSPSSEWDTLVTGTHSAAVVESCTSHPHDRSRFAYLLSARRWESSRTDRQTARVQVSVLESIVQVVVTGYPVTPRWLFDVLMKLEDHECAQWTLRQPLVSWPVVDLSWLLKLSCRCMAAVDTMGGCTCCQAGRPAHTRPSLIDFVCVRIFICVLATATDSRHRQEIERASENVRECVT